MNTPKPKAKPARKPDRGAGAGEIDGKPATAANPYAISPRKAAEAVRRAGIVTPGGKLTRIYK